MGDTGGATESGEEVLKEREYLSGIYCGVEQMDGSEQMARIER